MAFLKESVGTLRLFFLLVGLLNILSLNPVLIVFGIIYLYLGIFLEKILPEKRNWIIGAIAVGLLINVLFAITEFAQVGITTNDVIQIGLSLFFSIYLIYSVKNVIVDNKAIKSTDHTIRNFIIFSVLLAIIAAIWVYFLNQT